MTGDDSSAESAVGPYVPNSMTHVFRILDVPVKSETGAGAKRGSTSWSDQNPSSWDLHSLGMLGRIIEIVTLRISFTNGISLRWIFM